MRTTKCSPAKTSFGFLNAVLLGGSLTDRPTPPNLRSDAEKLPMILPVGPTTARLERFFWLMMAHAATALVSGRTLSTCCETRPRASTVSETTGPSSSSFEARNLLEEEREEERGRKDGGRDRLDRGRREEA